MKITNCPNCGAILDEPRCKYCGSCVVDFADITPNANDIIYIRINGMVLPTRCTALSITQQYDSMLCLDADFVGMGKALMVARDPEIKINAVFRGEQE